MLKLFYMKHVLLFYNFRRRAKPFYLQSMMHSKVLDVRGDNRSPGAEVIVYDAWHVPRDNQLWYEDQRGIIRSQLNDFALDCSAGLGGKESAIENMIRNKQTYKLVIK